MRFVLICSTMSIGIGEVAVKDEHGSMLQSIHTMDLSLNTSRGECWKRVDWRGVGTVPNSCGEDMVKKGALCYEKCNGDTPVPGKGNLDCWSKCPDGWRNDGAYCRLAEYGRGVGYPRWAKDRCEQKFGEDNCEKFRWTDRYYQKCRPGYHAAGCCVCRPNRFKCSDFNLGHQVDISCHKKKTWASLRPKIPKCRTGLVYDAGLCYNPCKKDYDGVGPLCWSRTPPGMKNCGAMAVDSHLDCVGSIVAKVTSVLSAVANIASMGAGMVLPAFGHALDDEANTIVTYSALMKLVQIIDSSRASIQTFVSSMDTIGTITQIVQAMVDGVKQLMGFSLYDKLTRNGCQWVKPEDFDKGMELADNVVSVTKGFSIQGVLKVLQGFLTKTPDWFELVKLSTQILAFVDPTGIMSVVDNFLQRRCPHAKSKSEAAALTEFVPDVACGKANITKEDLDEIQITPTVDEAEIMGKIMAMEVAGADDNPNDEMLEASSNIMLANRQEPRKCLQPYMDGKSVRLTASTCDGSNTQEFVWNLAGQIYSSNASTSETKMCLTSRHGKCFNGNPLTLWPCKEQGNHFWKYEGSEIKSIGCRGYCVDVYADHDDPVKLQAKLHKCWGGDNQKFDRPVYAP